MTKPPTTPGTWKLTKEDADEFWFRDGYWAIRIGPGRGYCVPVAISSEVDPAQREADARLIAAAPELLAETESLRAQVAEFQQRLDRTTSDRLSASTALLENNRALRAQLASSLAVLREVEWKGEFHDCPCCGKGGTPTTQVHAPDCKLAAVLKG
jgi:hypothetical protein